MGKRPTKLALRLRRNATEVEKQLWRAMREIGVPLRFWRQHPIGSHIVDFACPALKLAIELDGGQPALQRDRDIARTAELARLGYRVIRFCNNDVTENFAVSSRQSPGN
jgi:very-short-patch-repair endonuclease